MTVQNLQIPFPAESIHEKYRQLIADLGTMMQKLTKSRFQTIMKCRPGCSECCMQFSVLPLEAAFIVGRLVGEPAWATSGKEEKCVFLADDLCQVYEVRPIICRTQGLPLGYIDEEAGSIEVSACPLNFPDDFPFTHEDLLYMDQFNGRLAELNLQYCQGAGLDPEKRIPLAELVPSDCKISE